MERIESTERHSGDFLTLEQAGQMLGLDPRTIKRQIEEGRLVAFRVGRRFRIRRLDLLRFLRDSQVKAEVAPR